MIPLIYIAGPFRGPTPLDVRRNVERARDVGLMVAKAGGYPMIPHTMTAEFDKQLTDTFWLDGTMEMLRRCCALVALPSWERSTGARTEVEWAKSVHMPNIVVDYGDALQLEEFITYLKNRQHDGIDYLTWPGR